MFKLILVVAGSAPVLFLALLAATNTGMALVIGCSLVAGVVAGIWRGTINCAFPPKP